jgi:energy-coupling factor transporter ATP-binding protein EcfA2
MSRHTLHGLVVDSDIELHAPFALDHAPTDVTVRRVTNIALPHSDTTTCLYDQAFEGQAWHRVTQCDGRTFVNYSGVATFRIGEHFDTIEYAWMSKEPEHLGPILLEGYVVALLLTLRGKCVLHASAVEIAEGRALALVGPSGSGKTTLATLLAAGGQKHLADDIVSVDLSPTNVARIHSGSRAIRLREKAWELRHLLPNTTQSVSVDNRLVLEHADAETSDHQLAAVWLPVPDRTVDRVTVERIDSVSAFQQILPNLRIELNDALHRRQAFEAVVELTKRVPTALARVPWDRPGFGKRSRSFAMQPTLSCRQRQAEGRRYF